MATATIAFDASDYGGMDFDPRRAKVYATNSAIDQMIYAAGNKQYIGSGNGTIASDGTGSIVVPIPGVGDNPSTWQTTIHFDVPDRNGVGGRRKVSAGPFTITATGTLNSLVEEMPLLPAYAADVLDRLDALEAGGGGGSGGSSALIVVSGGTVDLPAYEGDTTPVVGYLVTATTTIEGTEYAPGVYIFYGDPGVYGGWSVVHVEGEQVVPSPDAVSPTAGTLASSAITATGATVTVTGGADDVALHATPYSFSKDNGTTWTAYQSSNVYAWTGLTGSTAYQMRHRVRDAAGNVSTGTAITVTTSAVAGWSVIGSDDFTAADGTKIKSRALPVGGISWSASSDVAPEIQSNKMVWASPTEDAGVVLALPTTGATGVEVAFDYSLAVQVNTSVPYIEIIFPDTPAFRVDYIAGAVSTRVVGVSSGGASNTNLIAPISVPAASTLKFRRVGDLLQIVNSSDTVLGSHDLTGGYTSYYPGKPTPNTVTVIGYKFRTSSIDNFVARKYV